MNQVVLQQLLLHKVPASPVLSPVDALTHPHFLARDMVRWVDDPLTGTIPIPGFPFKFGAQPELPAITAPLLGEHTDEVLADAGYSPDEIEQLRASGAIG